jgi:hypothetical protein
MDVARWIGRVVKVYERAASQLFSLLDGEGAARQ